MTGTEPSTEKALDWGERWSDRISPILVREIQQATSSRAFIGTLSIAVATVVMLALVFAWFGDGDPDAGRVAFAWCLGCLAPVVLMLVPMQAFNSMRQEVSGGTAEQLLMTRLRPSRIVLGKMLAGLAQFVLFLGVFAPLMALTFLLRGVDVATILLMLLFAVLASGTATLFAVAMAAVPGSRAIQQSIYAVASAALVIATLSAMAGAYELPREIGYLIRDRDFWMILTSICGLFVLTGWLCAIIAITSLAHGYENRSSPFRGFVAGVLVAAMVWAFLVVDTGSIDEAPGFISALAALFSAPFWLWAVCEAREMSPRVRTLVPRRGWIAWLAVPFLPGGDRGAIFTLLLAAVGISSGFLVPRLAGTSPDDEASMIGLMAWCYVIGIAGIGRLVRDRFGDARRHSVLAFGLTLLIVSLGSVLPIVVEILLGGSVGAWHLGHLSNPFFTVLEGSRRRLEVVIPVLSLAAVFTLTMIPALVRGVREVASASAERRHREA